MASEFFVDVETVDPNAAPLEEDDATDPGVQPGGDPQPMPVRASGGKRVVSEAQLKRFWGKTKTGQRSRVEIDEALQHYRCCDATGKPDAAFITVDIYDRLCAWAEGTVASPAHYDHQRSAPAATGPRRPETVQQGGMFGGSR